MLRRNGFQGAPLCTQTTKMEESGDARRLTSETKWETQLRGGREGADKEGRKFEIECQYLQKDKTWPANKDPSLQFLPIYLFLGLFSRVLYFMFWQCGANVKSGHKTNLVRLRKRTRLCLNYATEIWRSPAYLSKM